MNGPSKTTKPVSAPRGPEPAARDDVSLLASRCPFCHEDVGRDALDAAACCRCLARHHAACWEEHGACGACRGEVRLVREARPSPPSEEVLERAFIPEEVRALQTQVVAPGLGVVLFIACAALVGGKDPAALGSPWTWVLVHGALTLATWALVWRFSERRLRSAAQALRADPSLDVGGAAARWLWASRGHLLETTSLLTAPALLGVALLFLLGPMHPGAWVSLLSALALFGFLLRSFPTSRSLARSWGRHLLEVEP